MNRVLIMVACLVGGAVARMSVDVFEFLLEVFAPGLPRALHGLIAGVASTVVVGAVGWRYWALIVRWGVVLQREWEQNRQRRQEKKWHESN